MATKRDISAVIDLTDSQPSQSFDDIILLSENLSNNSCAVSKPAKNLRMSVEYTNSVVYMEPDLLSVPNEPKNYVENEPEHEVFCPIMQSEYPSDECYRLNCKYSHCFSLEALTGHLKNTLMHETEGVSAPYITACPLANIPDNIGSSSNSDNSSNSRGSSGGGNIFRRCEYTLSQSDTETVLDTLLAKGFVTITEANTMWATAKDLYLSRAHRTNGHVRCIKCAGNNNEGVWFDISATDSQEEVQLISTSSYSSSSSSSSSSKTVVIAQQKFRVVCPVCAVEFCSQCNSTPYHYGCDCNDLITHVRASLEWIEKGRDEYIQEAAVKSEQYMKLLTAHTAKTKDAQEARERYQQLVLDEQYKVKTCKLCPKCKRVIEKLSGCDAMVCGADAHGGNSQKGCGHRFSWSSAPKYVANVGDQKKPRAGKSTAPSPDPDYLYEHKLCEGVPLCCDLCAQPIVGVRLKCLHCVCFNMCLSCSMTIGHEVANKHLCAIVFNDDN